MNDLLALIDTLPTLQKYEWQKIQGHADYVPVDVKPTAFIRDGLLFISMEEGDGAGDYDGLYISEFRQDGIPYINEKLVNWAKDLNAYWEWYDAGSIVLAI